MKIFSFAALAVTALALQSYRAEAQDATSTSSSNSTSGAASRSGSFSSSQGGAGGAATSTSGTSANNQQSRQNVQTGLTLNQNGVAQPASTNSNNSGYYQNTNSGFTSSDNIVRAAPPVYAPNVQGGNPCTVGYSVGVSWIGAGVAGGLTTVDEDCANRQKIAMIHNAGYAGAAKELMCNDKATYFAFRSSGQPCVPRPQFDGPPVAGAPPPPVVQRQPVPIAPPPQQVTVKDRTNLPRCSRTVTDNCYAG